MRIKHYEQTSRDLILLEKIGKQKKTMLAKTDLSDATVFKNWGFEYMFYGDKDCCGWFLHINRHYGTSFHCHMTKLTVVYVVSGMLLLTTSMKRQLMMPGSIAIIDKKTFHMMGAVDNNTRVIELETPSNKTDAIRMIDHWGRVGEPYESQALVMRLEKKHANRSTEKSTKKLSKKAF